MNSPAPRPAVEKPIEDDGSDDEWQDMEQEQLPDQEHDDQDMGVQVHPNTIILPVETRPIEELRAGARRQSARERKRPVSFIEESYQTGETVWEEDGEIVLGINVL